MPSGRGGTVPVIALTAALFAVSNATAELRGRTCLGRSATIVQLDGGRVVGTPRADVIVTGGEDDVIYGGGGNDRICAGPGDDHVAGGKGSDRIAAGAGSDEIEGGNGSDFLLGGHGSDVLLGNRGNDRLFGGAGDRDFVDAGLGDDTVAGGAGDRDQVIGGLGNDRLSGGPGAEDVLRGDRGADFIDGGAGPHDVASFAVSGFRGPVQGGHGVVVDLREGNATQDGEDKLRNVEDVVGTPFSDVIYGDRSTNVLHGGAGDDRLVAVGEGDVAVGGSGSDSCIGFMSSEECGREPLIAEHVVEAAVPGSRARSSLIVVVRRGHFIPGVAGLPELPDVSITVSFDQGSWVVSGAPLAVRAGDHCSPLSNHQAKCAIEGTPDAVLVAGEEGDDLIEVDHSVPSSVSAILRGDKGADVLLGGPGDDSLNGAAAGPSGPEDVLKGRGGDDALTHEAILDGGAGSDLLIAAACGRQTVDGGPGVDSISFARSYLGLGVQVRIGKTAVLPAHRLAGRSYPAGCPIRGSSPTRVLPSIESVEGSPEDDVIIGDGSANSLLGRAGDDLVIGGGGDDFLVGGTGQDTLFGSAGQDRLYGRDGARDRHLSCGAGRARRDVATIDRHDPAPHGCRVLSKGRR